MFIDLKKNYILNLRNISKLSLILLFVTVLNSFQIYGQDNISNKFLNLPTSETNKQLSNKESHSYKFELLANEFIQFSIKTKKLNLILKVKNEKGALLRKSELIYKEKENIFSFVANSKGKYFLEISPSERVTKSDFYQIYAIKKILSAKIFSSEVNKSNRKIEIENTFIEGLTARITAGQAEKAVQKFSEALNGWEELNNPLMINLTNLLLVQSKARKYFIEARNSTQKKTLESFKDAVIKFNLAGQLYNEGGDKVKSATAYSFAGVTAFQYIGDFETSLKSFQKALTIVQDLKNPVEEATILKNIGSIHNQSGYQKEALYYYEQAYKIYSNVNASKETLALLCYEIGVLSRFLNQKQKALGYFIKSRDFYGESSHPNEQVKSINEIAWIYQQLGLYDSALESYNQALELVSDNKPLEAKITNNKGSAYYNLGDFEKALETFKKALKIYSEINSQQNQYTKGIIHTNIGLIYSKMEKLNKALEILTEKALPIMNKIDNEEGKGAVFINMATVYSTKGNHKLALDYLYKALPLFISNNQSNVATILGNSMQENILLNKPEMAILMGKLSVAKFQELRSKAKKLDIEDQKSFLKRISNYYKTLIKLLVKNRRIDEAVEILHLYQNQQFFDFDDNLNKFTYKNDNNPTFTKIEKTFLKDYKLQTQKVDNHYKNIQIIKNQLNLSSNNSEKNLNMLKIEKLKYANASNEFVKFLSKSDKLLKNKSVKIPNSLEVIKNFGNSLNHYNQNPNNKQHISIHTVITSDSLFTFLITNHAKKTSIKTFVYNISESNLNKKVANFTESLKNKRLDPYETGNEIYKIIFNSVSTKDKKTTFETELARIKPDVLHWSLDGALRYIPIAALSDKNKHFLIEKYETAVFTRSNKESFTRKPQKWMLGVGFGTEKEYKEGGFSRLTYPPLELKNIFTKYIKGNYYIDKNFTEKKLLEILTQTKPKPNLVQFSNHFNFEPGDAQSSFLLLGAGTDEERKFTLYDMQKYPNLFQGVDLVMAAACNTAGYRANGNGKEIDAFAELAQRLGAASVIATLWSVDDAQTSGIVTEFYKLYSERIKNKTNPDDFPAKSELLREAQLAHLKKARNGYKKCSGNTRGIKAGNPSTSIKKYKGNPCKHPNFWAPFVLYGSPR